VHYGVATAEGGTRPVQIACAPASDSTFPVGTTSVTCTGTDARGVTASCTFNVTLNAPPRLGATNFVAFGDSITAGEITVQGEGHIRIQTIQDALSYPTDLRTSLTGRYGAQTILLDNAGAKGELTKDGLSRLPSVLSSRYQVLLLMEGANDISNQLSGAARDQALANLRSMVRLAKSRNFKVLLGTLPPENPLACCPRRGVGEVLLSSFNAGVQSIGAGEGVPVVDTFAAFNGDLTLLGPDGLHPTAQGYQVIANAFFTSIKATFETAPTTSFVPSFLKRPSSAALPRR
jgi:acyl-CoA thioesterase I